MEDEGIINVLLGLCNFNIYKSQNHPIVNNLVKQLLDEKAC
jgi:hypothetical protein